MTRSQIVVIAGSEQIRWHHAHVISRVLIPVSFTEFYTRDLRYRVGLIRLLQSARQQVLFFDRLWTITRIDTATTHKHQPTHPRDMRSVYQVSRNRQILVDE